MNFSKRNGFHFKEWLLLKGMASAIEKWFLLEGVPYAEKRLPLKWIVSKKGIGFY